MASHSTQLVEPFLAALPSTLELVKGSLTAFHEISTTECTDSAYLQFRKKLCTEAYMYGRRIYPSSIDLIKSVNAMLEIHRFIDYEVDQFLNLLPSLVQQCRQSVDQATRLSLQHSFARARLEKLGNDVKRQQTATQDIANINKAEASGKSTAAGWSAAGGIGAVIAGGVIGWPILLASPFFFALGAELRSSSNSQSRKASQQQLTALGLKSLTDAIGEQYRVITSIGDVLNGIANRLDGVARAGGNNTEQLAQIYLKMIQEASVKLLPALETILLHRTDYETTILRLGLDHVDDQLKLEWTEKWEDVVNGN